MEGVRNLIDFYLAVGKSDKNLGKYTLRTMEKQWQVVAVAGRSVSFFSCYKKRFSSFSRFKKGEKVHS